MDDISREIAGTDLSADALGQVIKAERSFGWVAGINQAPSRSIWRTDIGVNAGHERRGHDQWQHIRRSHRRMGWRWRDLCRRGCRYDLRRSEDDIVTGGLGNDLFYFESGNDTFKIWIENAGDDTIDGGTGLDTIWIKRGLTFSRVDLPSAKIPEMERLQLWEYDGQTSYHYAINGTDGADRINIFGVLSVDRGEIKGRRYVESLVYLEGGNDSFTGHPGRDWVEGEGGNDVIYG